MLSVWSPYGYEMGWKDWALHRIVREFHNGLMPIAHVDFMQDWTFH